MLQREFNINNLRVAKPCPASWDNMSGDERARHCDLCSLNVYNISAMTEKEAQKLIVEREGRLCIRLYKRADGTVLTKDCPVGLRAYRKRVASFASAAFAAVLGLFSISFGQDKMPDNRKTPEIVREKVIGNDQKIELSGTICDEHGAVIPGVTLKFIRVEDKKIFNTSTNADGEFIIKDIPKGIYDLETGDVQGFKKLTYKNLDISDSERINITLLLSEENYTLGISGEMPFIDTTSTTTTIFQDVLPRVRTK